MPYAIMAFVVLLGIGAYLLDSASYKRGFFKAETLWQVNHIKTQLEEARKRSKLAEKSAAARVRYMRAADEAQKQRENLSGVIIDMHVAGLWIDPDLGYKGCRAEENTDTQVESGAAYRIRLPDKIEGGILSMTKDAQLVVGQYNELREIMKNLPCVVIVD